MDNASKNVSEAVILDAARAIFTEKGMAAARMQEIADRAGINKALLHYYFRSKEKLFDRVFQEAFQQFWPKVEMHMSQPVDARSVLKGMIGIYVDLFVERPYLPNFIISEINRDATRLEGLMRDVGVNPSLIANYLASQMKAGVLVEMDPRELILDVISLCVFPVAGRPLVSRFLWQNDQEAYQQFLINRKHTICEFIERSVFIK